MAILANLVIRFRGWILTLATLLTIPSIYYSFLLYRNLRPDFEELLPTTARSVRDLVEVTSRLEFTEKIQILIFSQEPQASKRFVDKLALELEKIPRETLALLEYRIDQEQAFFLKRRALFLDFEDLKEIRDFIQARIEFERELYNPVNIFRTTEIPEPKYGFQLLESKYQNRVSAFTRFPDGYYASADQKIRVMICYLPGKTSGVESARKLRQAINQAIARVDPQTFAPDMKIAFSGGVQNVLEETDSLMKDLELSTIIVFILVGLSLWVYFKKLWVTGALLVSLIYGVCWTFGVSYFLIGYLNANSAFLGAIVTGNGINFGIIFLSRYIEEIRKRRGSLYALLTAMRKTSKATVVAALAAGLAYGSLILTDFRGFRQFGLIGLFGMVFCWLAAFSVLPTLLLLKSPKKWRAQSIKSDGFHWISHQITQWVSKHYRLIWKVSLGLTFLALVGIFTRQTPWIENDLSKLRDKKSLESGSVYYAQFVDQVFGRELTPIVILTQSLEEAVKIQSHLKMYQKEKGASSFISNVFSLEDFVPQDQWRKIKTLKEIKALLPNKIYRRLEKIDQKRVNELLNEDALQVVNIHQLPELIKRRLSEKDGSIGKLVLVEPPLGHELWDGANLGELIQALRKIADSVGHPNPVAGQLPITSDMFQAVLRDGPRATLFAFLSVVILVLILFRHFARAGLVLISLGLGVLWLLGFMGFFELKINFLNFIALPITFGIGVDYAVNIIQRQHTDPDRKILQALRQTGGAVILASITTIIGYGSLLIAGNQAFVSFGAVAVIGEITCLLAALLTVPSLILSIRSPNAILKHT